MLLPCGDNDQAGDLGALTLILWNKLKYNFYISAHLSSGSNIWLCVFCPPAPKPLLLATFREAVTWALIKGHTTFLSINSDLMYYLIKVIVPLRASYFLPD